MPGLGLEASSVDRIQAPPAPQGQVWAISNSATNQTSTKQGTCNAATARLVRRSRRNSTSQKCHSTTTGNVSAAGIPAHVLRQSVYGETAAAHRISNTVTDSGPK